MGEGLLQRLVAAREDRGVEGQSVSRLRLAGIGAREPEADVKKLLYAPAASPGLIVFSSCTARLRNVLMNFALANTASPAARRKLGSCSRAAMLS
jgi:hypothetical protein